MSGCEIIQQTKLKQAYIQLVIESLNAGKPIQITVLGQSMYPAILSGSLVKLEPLSSRELQSLQIGELIFYLTHQEDQAWVLHRLIKYDADLGFILGGDRLPVSDLPVASTQILARVLSISLPELSDAHGYKWWFYFSPQFALTLLTAWAPRSFLSRYLGLAMMRCYRFAYQLRQCMKHRC